MQHFKKIQITSFILLLAIAIGSNVAAQNRRGGGGGGRSSGGRGGYQHSGGYAYHNFRPYASLGLARPYGYYGGGYYGYNRSYYRSSFPFFHFGPAFGFRLNVLPFGYYPFYIGANPYYYYQGVYYQPYYGGGYQVIAPPLGATVYQLPATAKVTVIDGQKYYTVGGTFYQEEINQNNQLSYRVVGIDGVINTAGNQQPPQNFDNGNSPAPYSNGDMNNGMNNGNNYPNNNTLPAPQNNAIPQIGARFDNLPQGSRQVVINKQKYYLSPAGVYYQEVVDGNTVRYEVTGNSQVQQ